MSLLNPLFDPAREAALVTGAGNGIGRAIAHALVGEGMRTVIRRRARRFGRCRSASPRPELAVHVPFGGVKNSGFGREGGRYSLEELTEVKWITVQMGKRAFPF